MTHNGNYIKIYSSDEIFLQSKISEITSACDFLNNMMVSIYLINKEQFIYCNGTIKKFAGDNCNKLLNGGWSYWFSLIDKKESLQVRNKIFTQLSNPQVRGQVIMTYHISNTNSKRIYLRHEILLYQIRKYTIAINYFSDVTVKEKIEKYFRISRESGGLSSNDKQIKRISPREKEVLNLVADGYSSKQIADRLFISNHTAISHRKNLIKKFEVKNTAQLIKRASRIVDLW